MIFEQLPNLLILARLDERVQVGLESDGMMFVRVLNCPLQAIYYDLIKVRFENTNNYQRIQTTTITRLRDVHAKSQALHCFK
jgi:hypothetical protein